MGTVAIYNCYALNTLPINPNFDSRYFVEFYIKLKTRKNWVETKQTIGWMKFLQDELSKSLYKHLQSTLQTLWAPKYISKEVIFTPTSLNEYKSALHIYVIYVHNIPPLGISPLKVNSFIFQVSIVALRRCTLVQSISQILMNICNKRAN